jgi:hypothetical protein
MTNDRRSVEVTTNFRLVSPDAMPDPVRASLRYDESDPFAVRLTFLAECDQQCDAHEDIIWYFARELLAIGLDDYAGLGDVRVWPWTTPRGDFVALALTSPDGNALFEVSRSAVIRFLKSTYLIVPREREIDHLDVNNAITRLLTGR